MKTTKEEIIMTSLKLFAEKGFAAVSTSMIAAELGITKGALYRHFESKQAIFDAIIAKMFELDAKQAEQSSVPKGEYEEDKEAYRNTALADLCSFVIEQYSFWTENEFAALFRRMLTIEQYTDIGMNKLYQDVLTAGPVRYTEDLFNEMLMNGQLNEEAEKIGAHSLAIMLFAPLQLSIQLSDGGENSEAVKDNLKTITGHFEKKFLRQVTPQSIMPARKGTEMDKVIIRNERPDEYREVEELVRESFWNVYRPGCLEHYVLNQLRNDSAFVPELDFVMELDGKIIGQNMFMKAVIQADDNRTVDICTMGPICIAPELKRKGYGKMLLDYSLEKAKEYGFKAICFEGNIDFYGKSGVRHASEFGIRYHGLPEGENADFFLCKELEPGYLDNVTGEYTPPEGYFVDEAAAEEFDRQFPAKEKLKLPGQLF